MTALTASWRATTGQRWRKCFSTSRAGGFRKPHHERIRRASRYCGASHPRDDPALLVSPALVMAAAAGIAVLAGFADHHLGIPAKIHRAECRVLRPGWRHADRRGYPLGHPVSRPARLLDLVSRGDVGAQSRQPDDEPAKAD